MTILVESIIIDGNKYVPAESDRCIYCALSTARSCTVSPGVPVCKIFDEHALKKVKKE